MNTHEQIRNRILRTAARQWGLQESEMDLEAFDPLVRLLIEACTGEVARLDRSLAASEQRILERILEQLSPEVLTGPQPAHAMTVLRALDGRERVTPELQCYADLERQGEKLTLFFTPLADFEIVDGAVACLELGGERLYRINDQTQREHLASGQAGYAERGSSIWLGLELGKGIESVVGLRFYFNWLNSPRIHEKLEWLRSATFTCDDRLLSLSGGLRYGHVHEDVGAFLQREYSRHQRSAIQILAHYAPHVITLNGFASGEEPEELRSLMQYYPPEFEQHYPLEELVALDRKLLWIKVAFPTQLNREDLRATTCALNAVPMANLRLHQTEGRLRDQLNIVPLETETYYFDLVSVKNRHSRTYDEVPLTNLRDYRAGQYSVRRRGAGKFGERDAHQALLNVLDAIREESAAFSAYGRDALATKITRLNQLLKDLEQQVTERGSKGTELAYLIVTPLEKDRYLDVAYLSTNGEEGNGVVAGRSLDLVQFAGVDRKSLRLLTTTTGGRAPLSHQDRTYAYKKAIISRGRVVSREDIRAFCQAAFGAQLTGTIGIRKAIARGVGLSRGLERVTEVRLPLPLPATEDERVKLAARLREVERELNFHSAGILPIRLLRAGETGAA